MIVDQKKKFRKLMLHKRRAVGEAERTLYDQRICNRVMEILTSANVAVVHSYLPMREEINVKPLLGRLLDQGIRVICPKVMGGREMQGIELLQMDGVTEDLKGTQIPDSGVIYEGSLDAIIVPGLAFDRMNYRLGYGGGYYDRFLDSHLSAITLGLAYPFQVVERIPREEHDVALQSVIYFDAL